IEETILFAVMRTFDMAIDSCTWILYDGSKASICQCETFRIFPVEGMCQNTQGIGIPFKMCQVCPLLFRNHFLIFYAFTVGKKRRNRRLAGVTEGRVAQVVR